MAETKFNTGKVRVSYPHVFEKDQNGKYSLVALIPKTDEKTYQKVMEACKALYAEHKNNTLKGLKFEEVMLPIHDGDGRKPKGGAYGAECAGMWVLSAKTNSKPVIVDAYNVPVTDQDEVYPGTWGRVAIAFGVYNNSGNRGITCYLNGLKTYSKGDRFGNSFSAEAFDDGYNDTDLMEDDDEI